MKIDSRRKRWRSISIDNIILCLVHSFIHTNINTKDHIKISIIILNYKHYYKLI